MTRRSTASHGLRHGSATRLRPSQTAYEYAGALGEIVPTLKPELQVVATAKVEATYGRHIPTRTSLVAVHTAYARIRRSLFLLFFHPRRPKPPRS